MIEPKNIPNTTLLHEQLAATALTIAGSDPSGGAGLQADLKTFQQMGVYGMSVVTLLTVQNTLGVSRVQMVEVDLVAQQIDAVLADIPPKVIKIGALGTSEMVALVAEKLRTVRVPIVIDPVMVSKHGHSLVADDFLDSFKRHLLPLATLVTPNRFEAERLVGYSITNSFDARRAAEQLTAQYGCGALVKLGIERSNQPASELQPSEASFPNEYINVLSSGSTLQEIRSPFQTSKNTHGTGCVLAALIAAELATGQTDLPEIVRRSVNRISQALAVNHGLGNGIHPLETRLLRPLP